MKPITGPADVAIGDTVSLTTVNSHGVIGTVTKVDADGLTIRTADDGKKRTAKYSRIAADYRGRRVVYQFTLLTAHDVWQRKRPATPRLDTYVSRARAGFRAAAHDLAARTALHAEVDALADWYAVEPESAEVAHGGQ